MKNSYTLKEIILGLRDDYLINKYNLNNNHNANYLIPNEIISIYGDWCKRIFIYNNKLEIKIYKELGKNIDEFIIKYNAKNDTLIFNFYINNKQDYISDISKLIIFLLNKSLNKNKFPLNYTNIIDNSENAKKNIFIDGTMLSEEKISTYLINDKTDSKKIILVKSK